jgi:beta-N-acetylhexosaminidase
MARRRFFLCILVIAIGLSLRLIGPCIGLPILFVKYGGSVLWGAMIYLLVALATGRMACRKIVGAAMTIAVCVEFFRLYHSPSLDAFRLTMPGALLIGRVFSLWNILAYGFGALLAAAIDRGVAPRRSAG